ncbi:unnamed protein product [Brassicogethes aeneus]|uniref:Uncharacterized protein n=1 Tax=Brassicogethes aeneus TaxID=1431903 RepID=A0A9P0B0S2_BRAAE|nr:unnamed protein product [Brassicogethes aeneus]
MKIVLAFLALAVISAQGATLTDAQKEKLLEFHRECKESSGVEQIVIDDAKAGKYANDPKIKAHLFCVSKKIGLQNEAGEIQKDVMMAKLSALLNDQEIAKKMVELCAKPDSTPEETSYSVLKCYYQNTPDHVSLI